MVFNKDETTQELNIFLMKRKKFLKIFEIQKKRIYNALYGQAQGFLILMKF